MIKMMTMTKIWKWIISHPAAYNAKYDR